MPHMQTKAPRFFRHLPGGFAVALLIVAGLGGKAMANGVWPFADIVITNLAPIPDAGGLAVASDAVGTGFSGRPAVLVGDLAGLFDPVLIDRMGGWLRVAQRGRIRAANEDLFTALLNGGRFDPPEDILVAAIQTELVQVQCYDQRVDGVWGPSSSTALQRFAQTANLGPLGGTPDIRMFRAVIARPDLRCPSQPGIAAAPSVAAPAVSAVSGGASGGAKRKTTRRNPPKTGAAPADTVKERAPQINRGLLGTGVFR